MPMTTIRTTRATEWRLSSWRQEGAEGSKSFKVRRDFDGRLHLFPQIDPEMMSDGKEMKRYRKYWGIRKNEKGSSNSTETNVPKI